MKYELNLLHKQKVKERSRNQYANVEYKQRVIAGMKREQLKKKAKQFDVVIKQFLDKVKDGPDFV